MAEIGLRTAALAMIEVVMLHRVVDRAEEPGFGPRAEHTVRPGLLDAYLDARSDWEYVRPTREGGLQAIDGERRLLVTFDDGYVNAVEKALPILERHGAPAVYFVTTGFSTGESYPFELELADSLAMVEAPILPDDGILPTPGEVEGRPDLYEALRRELKGRPDRERDAFLEELARRNGYDRADVQTESFLDLAELDELEDHPLVTIGAHGRHHVPLADRSWTEVRDELVVSRRRLEEALGHDVHFLAYPYGSHGLRVRWQARQAGYRWAFGTREARPQRLGQRGRYRVPRIDLKRVDMRALSGEST